MYRSGCRRGVATLISAKIAFERLPEFKDRDGRYNMVIGRLEGMKVTVLNVYLMITQAQGIVICGEDFNLRLNPMKDASGSGRNLNNPLSSKVRGLLKEMRICDV